MQKSTIEEANVAAVQEAKEAWPRCEKASLEFRDGTWQSHIGLHDGSAWINAGEAESPQWRGACQQGAAVSFGQLQNSILPWSSTSTGVAHSGLRGHGDWTEVG